MYIHLDKKVRSTPEKKNEVQLPIKDDITRGQVVLSDGSELR